VDTPSLSNPYPQPSGYSQPPTSGYPGQGNPYPGSVDTPSASNPYPMPSNVSGYPGAPPVPNATPGVYAINHGTLTEGEGWYG
jgi:hypothetical protein